MSAFASCSPPGDAVWERGAHPARTPPEGSPFLRGIFMLAGLRRPIRDVLSFAPSKHPAGSGIRGGVMECNAIKEFRVLDYVFYRCPIRRRRPVLFYPFTRIMRGAEGFYCGKFKNIPDFHGTLAAGVFGRREGVIRAEFRPKCVDAPVRLCYFGYSGLAGSRAGFAAGNYTDAAFDRQNGREESG